MVKLPSGYSVGNRTCDLQHHAIRSPHAHALLFTITFTATAFASGADLMLPSSRVASSASRFATVSTRTWGPLPPYTGLSPSCGSQFTQQRITPTTLHVGEESSVSYTPSIRGEEVCGRALAAGCRERTSFLFGLRSVLYPGDFCVFEISRNKMSRELIGSVQQQWG